MLVTQNHRPADTRNKRLVFVSEAAKLTSQQILVLIRHRGSLNELLTVSCRMFKAFLPAEPRVRKQVN